MNKQKSRILAALFIAAQSSTPLFAAPLTQTFSNLWPDWNINGTNTARIDHYSARGARDSGPFPFLGTQEYDALDVNFTKAISPYEFKRVQAGVLLNNSHYRSKLNGLMVERASWMWEKGDAAVPFRSELGDFFGYFSYRTLQRNLKGGQLELQPAIRKMGGGHSFVVLAGVNEPVYRSFRKNDDEGNLERYFGGSWLWDTKNKGMVAVNAVQQYQRKNKLVTERNTGHVFSVVGERKFDVGRQHLTFEGEAGNFSGQRTTTDTNKSGDGTSRGYYADLSGRHAVVPLSYQLGFERYGKHYRPIGAIVTPDRRSMTGSAAWRFESGLRLRGRLQAYRNDLESTNPADTKVAGVSLQGPIALTKIPVGLAYDGFVRGVKNKARTQNQTDINHNLSLTAPLASNWNGHLHLFHQRLHDRTTSGMTRTTRQAQFLADRTFSFKGVEGVITPGIMARKIIGSVARSTDLGPSLGLGLMKGPHTFNANYNMFSFRRGDSASEDVVDNALALAYAYLIGQHRFGVDAEIFSRRPDGHPKTNSYRAGAFYTYSFDRPARLPTGGAQAYTGGMGMQEAGAPFLLTQLQLGRPLVDAKAILADAHIKGGVQQAGYASVYEAEILDDIDLRQRLVLLSHGGNVHKAVIVIDFGSTGSIDNAFQSFERVRRALVRRLGQPSTTVEEGQFTQNFADDVNSDQLVRVTEWTTAQGTVRLGIPHRLDRAVRMEIQFAKALPDARQTHWSVEGVR